MTNLGSELKGAREQLCRAQVLIADKRERDWLQEALDRIDRVAVLEIPDLSKFDRPIVADPTATCIHSLVVPRCEFCGEKVDLSLKASDDNEGAGA